MAKNTDNPNTPNGNDGDSESESRLQGELAKYKKAFQEEYESTGGNALDGDRLDVTANVEKYTRRFFRQNLAQAVAQVVWLSANSSSDAVRLNASKIIIKEALEDARKDGDPIKELMEALSAD
jgi:hypothetical protein